MYDPNLFLDEYWAVAGLMMARFGKLALARVAGEAARSQTAAQRMFWLNVLNSMRRSS